MSKVNVTDLINRIVQVLRWDLGQLRVSVREAGLLELEDPIKASDEG